MCIMKWKSVRFHDIVYCNQSDTIKTVLITFLKNFKADVKWGFCNKQGDHVHRRLLRWNFLFDSFVLGDSVRNLASIAIIEKPSTVSIRPAFSPVLSFSFSFWGRGPYSCGEVRQPFVSCSHVLWWRCLLHPCAEFASRSSAADADFGVKCGKSAASPWTLWVTGQRTPEECRCCSKGDTLTRKSDTHLKRNQYDK